MLYKSLLKCLQFCILFSIFMPIYFISHTTTRNYFDEQYVVRNELDATFHQSRSGRKSNSKNDKWIVITSISKPTEDIQSMAAYDDWTIVVVADKKTPEDWSYKNCVFLSVELQQKMNYEILSILPYNSYTRKMVGYLYAVEHGAKFIYDTDDDNLPIRRKLDSFDYTKYTTGLLYGPANKDDISKDLQFFNVYSHFGRSDVWPRGFPLEFISKSALDDYHLCQNLKTPIIQQGLVDQDSDVDAVYRMIYVKNKTDGLNIKFDPISPPVILSDKIYCPFNSQNTLFHYDAFWALILPVSVNFRVTDIWRGYFAQKLLYLIGNRLGFYGPNARQNRNPHDYFKDFLDEHQLYADSSKLVHEIDRWTCKSGNFSNCIVDLSEFMVEKHFWGEKDFLLTKAWINDLHKIGYDFPNLVDKSNDQHLCSDTSFVSNSKKRVQPELFQLKSLKTLNRFCGPFQLNKLQFSGFSETVFSHTGNVVLIITFNHRHFDQIPLLSTIYGPWFANVIFCASFPRGSNFGTHSKKFIPFTEKFSFINLTENEMSNGYFGYLCLKKVADMKINGADGYLVISDDMLLNFWNPYDLTKVHLHNACEKVIVNGNGWQWWNSSVGEPALITLQQFLNGYSSKNVQDLTLSVLKDILMIPIWCASDIYYVPQKHLVQYQILSELFFNHGVFLEIAVPKILSSLGWSNRYKQIYSGTIRDVDLDGKYLWILKDRGNPFNFYDNNDIFIHPIKMSLFDQPSWRSGFCNTYVSSLFDAVSKRRSD